ncbi:post-transcriptional regulator [Salsuginibacillus kocurii]|uniref:post-transcriptional regulator n=1 Tax=Salsuginibacillus kocurii TaxID=427078 RepID=UPI0003675C20|nr:post-transcriptional regulator [Salsuginibacillus kocurii]
MDDANVERFREDVEPALESKAAEFLQLGYGRIAHDELFDLAKRKLKKEQAYPRLHTIVRVILSIRPNDYMNNVTKMSLVEGARMDQDGREELGDLFQEVLDHSSD